MNGKHRARWLAEIVSELQRYHKKARGCAEDALITQALEKLQVARERANAEGAEDETRRPGRVFTS
jgi:hypothetical protein